MVGDKKIGSDKNFSWDFHLGMNSVGNFLCVVLWTVKLHLWYNSIGSNFSKDLLGTTNYKNKAHVFIR